MIRVGCEAARFLFVACIALVVAGCASTSQTLAVSQPMAVTPVTVPDAIHWYRDAAEQKAIYLEVYRAAVNSARTLAAGLPEGSWGVILDIDETVLDNSDYQKRQALAGQGFSADTWNAWILERRASRLPGAKEFIDTITDGLHGRIVLITNRKQEQCSATEDNLRAVSVRYNRILCDRTGDSDKNERFRAVVNGQPGVKPLNVLIWIGDNIQDFPSLSQQNVEDFSAFGTRYFAVPNPMYGSWQKVPAR
jgi:5'-nucleotidase (lipoprotein e(P4) family)